MFTHPWNLFPIIIAVLCTTAEAGRSSTSLYTIKNLTFDVNKEYFKDITAFYLPIRCKWGRIAVNMTVKKQIDMVWLDFSTFRRDADDKTLFNPMAVRFRVNVCDLAKDGADGMLFRFIDGIYDYLKELFHPCPMGVGTQILFADRTINSIPRKGQGPVIPFGYYKFAFDFRTDQNTSLTLVSAEFLYRGYL